MEQLGYQGVSTIKAAPMRATVLVNAINNNSQMLGYRKIKYD
jgi:hypothetical protein